MRLKSTISPTESNGDVPIAIVCFGEQRKFLKRSLDFHVRVLVYYIHQHLLNT